MAEFDPYDDYYPNDALPADEFIARKQMLEALIDEVVTKDQLNKIMILKSKNTMKKEHYLIQNLVLKTYNIG